MLSKKAAASRAPKGFLRWRHRPFGGCDPRRRGRVRCVSCIAAAWTQRCWRDESIAGFFDLSATPVVSPATRWCLPHATSTDVQWSVLCPDFVGIAAVEARDLPQIVLVEEVWATSETATWQHDGDLHGGTDKQIKRRKLPSSRTVRSHNQRRPASGRCFISSRPPKETRYDNRSEFAYQRARK